MCMSLLEKVTMERQCSFRILICQQYLSKILQGMAWSPSFLVLVVANAPRSCSRIGMAKHPGMQPEPERGAPLMALNWGYLVGLLQATEDYTLRTAGGGWWGSHPGTPQNKMHMEINGIMGKSQCRIWLWIGKQWSCLLILRHVFMQRNEALLLESSPNVMDPLQLFVSEAFLFSIP